MTQNKHKQSGFTLIETLVAILILTLAIAGGFSTISNGLRSAYLAKNQVTAFYLAQDIFEHLRYVRDSYDLENIDSGDGWDKFNNLILKCTNTAPCKADTTNESLFDYGITSYNNNDFLKYDEDLIDPTHFYNYSKGSNSIFKRSFYVKKISPHEIAVIVNVEWNQGFVGTKRLNIQTTLTNWH